MWDSSVGRAAGLMMQTLPFVALRMVACFDPMPAPNPPDGE